MLPQRQGGLDPGPPNAGPGLEAQAQLVAEKHGVDLRALAAGGLDPHFKAAALNALGLFAQVDGVGRDPKGRGKVGAQARFLVSALFWAGVLVDWWAGWAGRTVGGRDGGMGREGGRQM